MNSRDVLVKLSDDYLAAVLTGDGDIVAALFAPDGVVEDPIGAPVRRGYDQLRAFYGQPRDIRLVRRIGPVTVYGRSAAFQFEIRLTPREPPPGIPSGSEVSLVITDILTFGDDGRIVRMVGIPDALARAAPSGR